MTAGDLKDRVSIVNPAGTSSADGRGGRIETPSTLASVWASVTSAAPAPNESLKAGAVTPAVAYVVVIRYRTDVTPKMRLSWTPYLAATAKTLEIQGVQPFDGGREYLRLDCVEGVV
jgi:SPP1 family predicted phage head-tail adaptor